MRIYKKLQKLLAKLTWRQAFHFIIASFFLALFACFFDWLIINWLSGCCEGGICIPEWLYPQCQTHGGKGAPLRPQDKHRPPTGTILVREHRGVEHRVRVLNDGFEYNGKTYRSLSAVASHIAGVHWNGPVFFGLRRAK